MIRGSVVIAAIAVLLSLLLHATGLSITAPRLTEPPSETGPEDTVELGNRFEDLVDEVTEPLEPEPTEEPEPPVEEPPEPEPAEIPTSEVHVASDDPQQTFAPDTGTAELVQPEILEPIEPEAAETEAAEEGDATASDEAEETPVETAEVFEAPEGTPEAAEPVPEPDTSIETEVAVLPQAALSPEPTDAPEAEPSVAPEIIPQIETVDPDIPVAEEVPEEAEEGETSELAVTTSIRPRRPDRNPQPDTQGVLSGARDLSDLRVPTREIESPLTTYRRRCVDAFTQGDSGTRSGGRGPWNSDRTNYAGRVLVHLNRAPIVYTAARGFARVFFEINPDGTLAWVDVVDSSGTPDVERAAKAQVRAASPFPLPPGGVSRKLNFVYSSN